jgi:hypothetical protein
LLKTQELTTLKRPPRTQTAPPQSHTTSALGVLPEFSRPTPPHTARRSPAGPSG